MLRCLGLSALISCAAGCGFADRDYSPPVQCRDNLSGETFMVARQEQEGQGLILHDTRGNKRLYTGTISLTCGPASGTETRQGGDGTAPSRSDDGPARRATPENRPLASTGDAG